MAGWKDGVTSDPPKLLKVFSPGGDTTTFYGWVGIGPAVMGKMTGQCTLFAMYESGEIIPLNYRVVVWEEKTKRMAYSPRMIPDLPDGLQFEDETLREWLSRNPHWPSLLELEDTPTEEGLYG